jgi:hypothetical protein
MGHGRRRLLRNLWASLAVAATLAVIGVGLPVVNSLLPSARPVSAAASYAIAAGVSVRPPPGASIDVTQTQPGPRGGAVLFVVGTVRYAVVVTPFVGSLATAADHLREKIRETRGYQVAGGETAVTTAHGLTGRQGTYASVGRVGRYAVFVAHGLSVEVTVAGTNTELPGELPNIAASIRTLAFRTAS